MGTRGNWSIQFLKALGNNSPSDDMIRLVSAWTRAENTTASFNPLATTLAYGETTNFNSAGVKNYKTQSQGIEASVRTLNGNFYGYPQLLNALKTNDVSAAIASGGFDTWGSHTSAVHSIYLSGDYKDEPLKSEESGTVSGGDWTKPPENQGPNSSGGTLDYNPIDPSQSTYSNEYKPQGVTENDIRNIGRMSLGVLSVVIGVFIIISVVIKSDTAQTIVTTAVRAAV